jgi:hypothetical protein
MVDGFTDCSAFSEAASQVYSMTSLVNKQAVFSWNHQNAGRAMILYSYVQYLVK